MTDLPTVTGVEASGFGTGVIAALGQTRHRASVNALVIQHTFRESLGAPARAHAHGAGRAVVVGDDGPQGALEPHRGSCSDFHFMNQPGEPR